MQQSTISEKRAIERDNAIQKILFTDKKSFPKQLQVLRMEIRLGNRTKIKSLFQALGITNASEFQYLFDKAIAKKVLRHFWHDMKKDMPLLALSQFKSEDIVQAMMAETQGGAKPAKLLQRLGGLMLIRSVGLRGAKALMRRHSTARTWQRLKRELDDLNLPTKLKFAAMRHVDEGLSQFKPIKISELRQAQTSK